MRSQFPWDLVRLDLKLHFERLAASSISFNDLCGARAGRSPEDRHAGELGNDFLQKLQLFSADLRGKGGQSSNVSARSRKTGDEPASNWIIILRHDNWNRRQSLPWRRGLRRTSRDDDVYLETHQFGGERGEPIKFSLRRPILNDNDIFPSSIPSSRRPCRNASIRPRYRRRLGILSGDLSLAAVPGWRARSKEQGA